MSSVPGSALQSSASFGGASTYSPGSHAFLQDEGSGDSDDEVGGIDDWVNRSNRQQAQHQQRTAAASILKQQKPTVVPAMLPIIKCGWLEKLGDLPNKTWKTLWFVLRGDDLSWFKDSDGALKGSVLGSACVVGAIVTSDLTCGDTPDPNGSLSQRTFGIQSRGSDKTLAFRCAHTNQRPGWLTALEKVRVKVDKDDTNGSSSPTASNGKLASKPTRWKFDELCYGCRASFTLTKRRHHCRNCGHAYCHKCSSCSSRLPDSGFPDPVRVCEDCWEILNKPAKGMNGANTSSSSSTNQSNGRSTASSSSSGATTATADDSTAASDDGDNLTSTQQKRSATFTPVSSSSSQSSGRTSRSPVAQPPAGSNVPMKPMSRSSHSHSVRPRSPSPPQRVRNMRALTTCGADDAYVAFEDMDSTDRDDMRKYSNSSDDSDRPKKKSFCCF